MNIEKKNEKIAATVGFTSFAGFFGALKELSSIIFLSLIIVIPIRFFLVQPFIVKGESMEPNFHGGDYLIVNEIGWKLKGAERGEVVIFENPGGNGEYYIKRVIGLPGEKIEVRGGKIKIFNEQNTEGFVLDESEYLPEGLLTRGNQRFELREDEFFVLGDNRNHSLDSRVFGALDQNKIVGKTWIRAYPFEDFFIYSSKDAIR